MARNKKPPYDRLWKHIVKGQNEDDCWTWQGGKNNIGYPMIRGWDHQKMLLAHRVMGEHLGLPGPEIQRTCKSYECLNPLHLISGTTEERIDKIHADPTWKRTRLRHEFVECPVCKKRAWFPTLKRHHKQCFQNEPV